MPSRLYHDNGDRGEFIANGDGIGSLQRQIGTGAGVERHISFGLGKQLVDVAIEACHGCKAFQIAHGLRGVVGAPTPVRIHREQRDVAEHRDRGVAGQRRNVLLDELELVGAQVSELL